MEEDKIKGWAKDKGIFDGGDDGDESEVEEASEDKGFEEKKVVRK